MIQKLRQNREVFIHTTKGINLLQMLVENVLQELGKKRKKEEKTRKKNPG